MEISSGAIHTILTTELGYRSICGKWVPHKLSENQRLARLNIAKKLSETHENCDSRRLTEIVTDDETWVYYSTPYIMAKLTKNFLDVEGLEVLPHLPYSPNLAPCDFWLFPKLKIYLQGKDFNTLQAHGTGLYQYFKSIPEEEYRNVFTSGWKG
ncbi:hypothetical protein LOD99_8055 [Oopsacas minuta]|uniref:Transposase n=1 Tax=Oopsacas minuta TaxID=111878 RepID=A0AAV7JJK5_9METZ|nr:hypothetical protein LOD99_8055 [Oopsacas minuta]